MSTTSSRVRWGYGIFPPATERDSLAAIVREGLSKGLLFLSDADARPEYASDPRTNLWDDAGNGDGVSESSDGRTPRRDVEFRPAQHQGR